MPLLRLMWHEYTDAMNNISKLNTNFALDSSKMCISKNIIFVLIPGQEGIYLLDIENKSQSIILISKSLYL